jgi:hypothetical protein
MLNKIYRVPTVFCLIGSRNIERNSYMKDSGWSSEMQQTARRHIFNIHVSLRSASLCNSQNPPATSVLLGPKILVKNPCSTLHVRHHVAHRPVMLQFWMFLSARLEIFLAYERREIRLCIPWLLVTLGKRALFSINTYLFWLFLLQFEVPWYQVWYVWQSVQSFIYVYSVNTP